jgi:aspartate carbamoyltransferase catalytic subunit
MMPRHVIDIASLDDGAIHFILNRALVLAAGGEPQRADRTVANLFFEPSTRTRVSFELAAHRLGLTVINMDGERSSTTKGESLIDTLATLAAMGVEMAVLRHGQTGICREIADRLPVPMALINAGDGSGEHPTQALLDAAVLSSQPKPLRDMTVAIVGDLRHSRVARSNAALLTRLGVGELRLAGPAAMLPDQAIAGVALCTDLEQAVADADVVMMLRVQRERMDRSGWPDPEQYYHEWGLNEAKLARAKPDCKVMHPGPINRGMELDAALADGPRSLILEQVRMSVPVRMAIFEQIMAR